MAPTKGRTMEQTLEVQICWTIGPRKVDLHVGSTLKLPYLEFFLEEHKFYTTT
jgi:hypothetical protein